MIKEYKESLDRLYNNLDNGKKLSEQLKRAQEREQLMYVLAHISHHSFDELENMQLSMLRRLLKLYTVVK